MRSRVREEKEKEGERKGAEGKKWREGGSEMVGRERMGKNIPPLPLLKPRSITVTFESTYSVCRQRESDSEFKNNK